MVFDKIEAGAQKCYEFILLRGPCGMLKSWNFMEMHQNPMEFSWFLIKKWHFAKTVWIISIWGLLGEPLGAWNRWNFHKIRRKFVPFSPFCGNAYNSNGIPMILSAPRDEKVPPGTDLVVSGAHLGGQEPLIFLRDSNGSVKSSNF